jgi:hypothetical protein
MSEQPKRRGRPPKAPEDRIQDIKQYYRDYHAAHKDEEAFKDRHRKLTKEKQKRTRDLYTLIKKIVQNNLLDSITEQEKQEIRRLTCCEENDEAESSEI